jgi:hypothetical protein
MRQGRWRTSQAMRGYIHRAPHTPVEEAQEVELFVDNPSAKLGL